jgi:hypothetical protein
MSQILSDNIKSKEFILLQVFSCSVSRGTFSASVLSIIAFLDFAWSSQGSDHFWSDLGVPQNPDSLLDHILERPEFKESSGRSFVAALIRWLVELITRWLNKFFGKWNLNIEGEVVWTALGAFFAVVLVAAILVGLYYAVKSFHTGERKIEDPAESPLSAAENCSELLSLSRGKAEAGEYGEALIFLFRYSLMRLDEQGRLVFYKGKTNREILRSQHLKEIDRDILSQMIPIFNCVRYGGFLCGKDDYERFLSLTDRLVDANGA